MSIKDFLTKQLLKRQLKDMPQEQQDMIIKMVNENPELFKKISEEVDRKVKHEGKEKMAATFEVMRMVTKAISKIPADDPEKSRAPQWIKDLHDAVNNYDVFDHSNGYTPDILNPTNSHHPLLAWWYVSDLNEAEKERHKLERMLHDVQKAMAAAEKSTTSSSTPLSLQEFNDPKEEMLLGSEGILPFLTPSLPAGLSYDLVSNLPKLRVRMPLDPKQLVKENLPAQTSPVPLKK
jgi:hypothetical protein